MFVDKSKITLVLNNLMSNALKFTAKCSDRHVSVVVDCEVDGSSDNNNDQANGQPSILLAGVHTVRGEAGSPVVMQSMFIKISVTDTGIGIAPVGHDEVILFHFCTAAYFTCSLYVPYHTYYLNALLSFCSNRTVYRTSLMTIHSLLLGISKQLAAPDWVSGVSVS
jgi:Histidine kinase-, DNA gyrase B-, and HSP90-like ATPase